MFAGHFINNLQEFEKWTIAAFDMDLSTTTFRLNADIPINNFNINTGVQYQNQNNVNNIESKLIPDSESNDFGVYTIVDYNTDH